MNADMNTMKVEDARKICQDFANRHKVIFDDEGECGFGRECVGFREDGGWIDHNPCSSSGDYEKIAGFDCPDAYAPDDVNSYHKHDCLAVLGRGDEAVIGLARWVQKMEAAGEVKLSRYATGATGLQAMLTGVTRLAVTIKPRQEPAK